MAANERITDIRVQLSLPTNRKVMRLERELGGAACWCLIKLWIYCASNEPDGCLAGWTEDDIEGVAGWGGMRGAFAAHAERIGLIDRTTGGFEVHDWTENQSWIAKANERTIAARTAARTRWSKLKSCDLHAEGMQGACEPNAALMPPSFPTNQPTNQPTKPSRASKPALCQYSPEFEELWSSAPPERRKGKGAAWSAYCKLRTDAALHRRMVNAMRAQVAAFAATGKSWGYFPMVSTWINQSRWDDDAAMPAPEAPSRGRGGRQAEVEAGNRALVERLAREQGVDVADIFGGHHAAE